MPDAFADLFLPTEYEGVAFHAAVTEAEVEDGHDFAEFTAFGRDGADAQHTGLKAKSGTLTAAFVRTIDPALYPDRYQELLEKFRQVPIGRLQHPTEGPLRAAITSWSRKFEAGQRGGVFVRIAWREVGDPATYMAFAAGAAPSADGAAAATSAAATADAAMATADPAGTYAPTSATVTAQLAYLEGATRSHGEVQAAVRAMLDPVERNLALPALSGAAAHDAVAALEALRALVYRVRDRYIPDARRVRTHTVAATQPLWQLALELYGSIDRASLLLAANTIPDPARVPAGTVLTVLPAE